MIKELVNSFIEDDIGTEPELKGYYDTDDNPFIEPIEDLIRKGGSVTEARELYESILEDDFYTEETKEEPYDEWEEWDQAWRRENRINTRPKRAWY